MKRYFPLLMTIIMLFTSLPAGVFAHTPDAEGGEPPAVAVMDISGETAALNGTGAAAATESDALGEGRIMPLSSMDVAEDESGEQVTEIENGTISEYMYHTLSAETNTITVFLYKEPMWLRDSVWDKNFIRMGFNATKPHDSVVGARLFNLETQWCNMAGYSNIGGKVRMDSDSRYSSTEKIDIYWYTSTEGQVDPAKYAYHDSFTLKKVMACKPYPVPGNGIRADGRVMGSFAMDGEARYPAGGIVDATTITTAVRAFDGAARYSLGGGEIKDVNGDVYIETVATPGQLIGQEYTIEWYDSQSRLIATERLNVTFPDYEVAFTPFTPEYGSIAFNSSLAGVSSSIDIGAHPGRMEVNVKMTDAQWEDALYQSLSSESVEYMFRITLPRDARAIGFVGTGQDVSDEQALNTLRSVSYSSYINTDGSGNKYMESTMPLAEVSYSGSKTIIAPMERYHSFLLKWVDGSGVEHFHRIDNTVKQASLQGVVIKGAAPEATRIFPNSDSGKDTVYPADILTADIDNSTVIYTVHDKREAVDDELKVLTQVERPNGSAAYARVIQNGFLMDNGKTGLTNGMLELVCWVDCGPGRNYQIDDITIEWRKSGGGLVKREQLAVAAVPKFNGPWVDRYWIPAAVSSATLTSVDPAVTDHLTYDENTGCWLYRPDPAKPIDIDFFTDGRRMKFYVAAPAGASYYKLVTYHAPFYSVTHADEVAAQFELDDMYSLYGEPDTEHWHYASYGNVYFNWGRLSNMVQVGNTHVKSFTTFGTTPGYAESAHIQWYDSNGELIQIDGKRGSFVYLIKEPYLDKTNGRITNEFDAEVEKPTVISPDGSGRWELQFEQPHHKDKYDKDKNYYKLYYLHLFEDGKLKEDKGAEVYLPYPDGVTYEDIQKGKWQVKLIHYDSELMEAEASSRVEIEYTPHGIKARATGFSPFLLNWTDTPGDMNFDGETSVNDAVLLANADVFNLLEQEEYADQAEVADANDDGKVDVADVIFICQRVVERR